jgi:hypothetical protein
MDLPLILSAAFSDLNEQPQPYGEIKYAAETKIGLMTQCVARDNARKKNFMTLINIAIKVPSLRHDASKFW